MKWLFNICLLFAVFKLFHSIFYKPDEDVLELNSSNFDATLEKVKYLLVEFYWTSCENCIMVRPEYIKAAKALLSEDSDIKLAGVDIEEQVDLTKRFNVTGYPTFKLFIEGKLVEDYDENYEHNATASEIVSWLKLKTMNLEL